MASLPTASKQAVYDHVDKPQARSVGLDGGINQKTTPVRLSPPATITASNALYQYPGCVAQLPGFQSTLSSVPQQPQYVYNLARRDAIEPVGTGDILVHGEVPERPNASISPLTYPNVQSSQSGFWDKTQAATSPAAGTYDWAALYPFSVRTRSVGAALQSSVGSSYTGAFTAQTCKGDIAGDTNPPTMYAQIGYGIPLTLSFGRLSSGAFGGPSVVPFPTDSTTALTTFFDSATVPGTNLCLIAIQRSFNYTTTFTLLLVNMVSGTFTTNSISGATSNQRTRSVALFRHWNHLLLAYENFTGANSAQVTIADVTTGVVSGSPQVIYNTLTPTGTVGGICAFSADPQGQSNSGAFVVCAVDNANVTRAIPCAGTYTNPPYTAGTAVVLPGPPIVTGGSGSPGQLSASEPDILSTGAFAAAGVESRAGNVATNVGCIFRNVVETYPLATGYASARTVLCHAFTHSYTYGTGAVSLTVNQTEAFRDPSGALIHGKAMATAPAEVRTLGVGAQAAKGVLCPVYASASDPYGGQAWSPTFYLIDHAARVASRWAEGKAFSIATTSGANGAPPTASIAGYNAGYAAVLNGVQNSFEWVYPYPRLSNARFSTIQFPAGAPTLAYVNPAPTNTEYQPALLTLGFQAQGAQPPSVQAGRNTIFSGGLTMMHDGRQLFEAGFHTPGPPVFSTDTSGSNNFFYRTVFTWTDSNGLVHRSQPSAPTLVQVASAQGANTLTAAIPMSTFRSFNVASGVGNGSQQVAIELYRSVNNVTDGNFYLLDRELLPARVVYNSGTATPTYPNWQFTFQGMQTSDTTLQGYPRLYTDVDGSSNRQYDSTAPYPFVWQTSSQGRHFGVACVDGLFRLFYSSSGSGLNAIGIPVEWNPNNYALVPPELGDVRSIAPMDDKILLFGTRGIGVMSGDGPPSAVQVNSALNANTVAPNTGFSLIQPLPTTAGVLATGSPVTYPDGVIYQDVQGFTKVGRNLAIDTNVGTAVDPLAGTQVGSPAVPYGRGILIAPLEAIVWCAPQSYPVVYDFSMDRWSTWQALAGAQNIVMRLDSTVFVGMQPQQGSLCVPSSTTGTLRCADVGYVQLAVNNSFNAAWAPGAANSLVLESPWLQLGYGTTGEGWLIEMALSLTWLGSHALTVDTGYDYAPYSQTVTMQVPTAPSGAYIVRLRPTSSRVRAVQYRVTIVPTSPATAYSAAIVNDMLITTGLKQGLSRVGSGASR